MMNWFLGVLLKFQRSKAFGRVTTSICLVRRRHYSTDEPVYRYLPFRTRLVSPVFLQAKQHLDRVAVVDRFGSHRYSDILFSANVLTDKILDDLDVRSGDTGGERVCLLCPNDVSYVVGQWATWMSGSISVPLSPRHPELQLRYFVEDSQSKMIITTEELGKMVENFASELGVKVLFLNELNYRRGVKVFEGGDESKEAELVNDERRWSMRFNRFNQLRDANRFKRKAAMIVYTSGTTGNPKGVVHTFGSLDSQMQGMIEMWEWNRADVILHVLPLHHVHGIVNALMTPLFCGASCIMLPHFDAHQVWLYLLGYVMPEYDGLKHSVNLFMAVPTIYAKLINYYNDRLSRGRGTRRSKDFVRAVSASRIRLFVSGSAALPTPVLHSWEKITGHRLLERYGMTELGMVLTNPIHGTREPGAVGLPFPNVEVCIAKPNVSATNGYDVVAKGDWKRTRVTEGLEKESGELYVRGGNTFKEYWNRSEATKESFTKDGWFKTGDTAIFDRVYRILGRTSVDIIKSGGYKISAIEVERHLLSHPSIADVAVVGLPDLTWGQKVAAAVVLQPSRRLETSELRVWASDRLPSYQIPTVVEIIDRMPHNLMGKVNKKQLVPQVFGKYLKN